MKKNRSGCDTEPRSVASSFLFGLFGMVDHGCCFVCVSESNALLSFMRICVTCIPLSFSANVASSFSGGSKVTYLWSESSAQRRRNSEALSGVISMRKRRNGSEDVANALRILPWSSSRLSSRIVNRSASVFGRVFSSSFVTRSFAPARSVFAFRSSDSASAMRRAAASAAASEAILAACSFAATLTRSSRLTRSVAKRNKPVTDEPTSQPRTAKMEGQCHAPAAV